MNDNDFEIKFNNSEKHLAIVNNGGDSQEWKNFIPDLSQNVECLIPEGITLEAYLDVILNNINRMDFPIILEPKSASFIDIAIHGILRQRLKKSTVYKRIAYARYMENHKIPIDFHNPNFKNFISHMDYREQVEHAGYGALEREWDTMKMILKSYGIPLANWPYKPPSRPAYTVKIVPFPDQVNEFLHFDYSDEPYENALTQYLLTHNFVIGWRIPSEPAIMKVNNVQLERGYIVITEPKKRDSTRSITPTEIMTNRQRKSLKNWIDIWRPKVENQYSKDYLYLKPNGRPFDKEALRMFLNRIASPVIKTIYPEYHNYIARDFVAIARLIRTKIQTKRFDEFEVKDFLGHTKIQTTISYIKDAIKYYQMAPYDWINRVLKAIGCKGEENAGNQQNVKKGAFDQFFSKKNGRTWREPNSPTEEEIVNKTPQKALLIFWTQKFHSILTKTLLFSFFRLSHSSQRKTAVSPLRQDIIFNKISFLLFFPEGIRVFPSVYYGETLRIPKGVGI